MFKHTGGQRVESGTYWDVMTGLRVDFDQEGMLPGGNGTTYMKASSSAILLLGPILGLAYVVLMPIMGIVTALSSPGAENARRGVQPGQVHRPLRMETHGGIPGRKEQKEG